jgi:hypothetical protein
MASYPAWFEAFEEFVKEFKTESDRAAVILGAAKLDALLGQIIDRYLLPTSGSADELLDGDSPLSTFSAKINASHRLGLIGPQFAKSLHLVRKIRNSFAHEVVGVSLQSGSHADRLKSLLLPLHPLPFFAELRRDYFGDPSPGTDFRTCLALMCGRLESILERVQPLAAIPNCEFILPVWSQSHQDQASATIEEIKGGTNGSKSPQS